jgi:RNA 3'-terminal phosphate cyclase
VAEILGLEQRMYEHIKHEAGESGRYGDRAEEVAARAVKKHLEREHHKKGE